MMYKKLLFPFLFLLFFAYSCDTAKQVVDTGTPPFSFTILQINDVYEIAPLGEGEAEAGGLARVAGLLRQLETENPNTIAVIAGDFLSPSFIGTLKQDNGERIAGLQMVETLNAMGMDYATFGNHEFDLKNAALLEKRLDQSEFEYMSANAYCVEESGRRPFRQNGEDVPAYRIHTFTTNGQTFRLALVGVVLPFAQPPYVGYEEVESSFATAVAAARRESDLVLGLTHLSIEGDEALAAAVPGLPLFMGGHEHHQLSRYVGETAITKADANAKTAYVHRITYYPTQKVSRIVSEIVPITPATPEDPATAAVVAKWESEITAFTEKMGYDISKQLTVLTTELDGTEVSIRSSQTNYGLLTNQSVAGVWPDADVYTFNSGSLRLDDKLKDEVTAYDVLRTFPYGGPMVRVRMPGSALQRLLDTGDVTNKGEGGYLQRYQATKKGDRWLIKDQPLEDDKTYSVVMPEFLALGLEANLGFLKDYEYEKPNDFTVAGTLVKNDLRDIVIWGMGAQF